MNIKRKIVLSLSIVFSLLIALVIGVVNNTKASPTALNPEIQGGGGVH